MINDLKWFIYKEGEVDFVFYSLGVFYLWFISYVIFGFVVKESIMVGICVGGNCLFMVRKEIRRGGWFKKNFKDMFLGI